LFLQGQFFRFVSPSPAECQLWEASTQRRHPDGWTDKIKVEGRGRAEDGGRRAEEEGGRDKEASQFIETRYDYRREVLKFNEVSNDYRSDWLKLNKITYD